MGDDSSHALSKVLDDLEHGIEGDQVPISAVVAAMGDHSFASLMLVFALISTSPASAIPGITAMVAVIEFLLVIQMIARRKSLWLPRVISDRRISTDKLDKGVRWLRRPVQAVERLLRPRMTALVEPPWIYLPLVLVLGVTLLMPFMEVIPTSGSIASAAIALFAAGVLTRDGLLTALAVVLLAAMPVAIGYVALGG
ncbi:exopolysaccharide biosynthesis protein [Methylobrevis pamukkalensis]|uniref:Exopolysaccharide synthesis, ExoD n=1 Tax=Methylobrevis pamukkalensis TaxID=1439726 RepID=A0A1E3H0B7_9HYPH|nr:exopolysaccharide biosynthesis protein [Methylobrevis pamukkalensis]ODN69788.1 Exopolysaccharide synthesis, ExoD [Methylobrevis pamukkalensis]